MRVVAGAGASASGCGRGRECEWLRERMRVVAGVGARRHYWRRVQWCGITGKKASLHYAKDENSHA